MGDHSGYPTSRRLFESGAGAQYWRVVRWPSTDLPSGAITDPCDGTTATTGGQVASACRAIPAVAAAIAAHGAFTYTPLDYQQIFGLVGSNPELQSEKSKTKTYGFVLTPSFVPNFSVSVDYFDINVQGAVSAIPFQTSINDCLATGTDTICNNVIRNAATGKITELLQLNLNVGYVRSTGIDTAVHYRWDMASAGRVDLSLTETHQLKLEQAVPGAPTEVDLGQPQMPVVDSERDLKIARHWWPITALARLISAGNLISSVRSRIRLLPTASCMRRSITFQPTTTAVSRAATRSTLPTDRS